MPEQLPVHFFTIVLNGDPFIRYHLDVLRQLPFSWRWHVVEGVAKLVHDTSWSLASGGSIPSALHMDGRSNDGTTEYLDAIARDFPDNVTVYRKPRGVFWEGKLEMVSAPLANIRQEALLWQLDADELWRADQISTVRERFVRQPHATAAYFWCNYFVGPNAVISTRNTYGGYARSEWLRVWRYRPGDRWLRHEPPVLVRRNHWWQRPVNVASIAPLWHAETEAMGAVFDHMAYVTPEQLQFKESYYGYQGAVRSWQRLQEAVQGGPVVLRHYFFWVNDNACVETASRLNVDPIARQDPASGAWRFGRMVGETGRAASA